MKIRIRPEKPEDYHAVEVVTKKAFLAFEIPDQQKRDQVDEHYLAHILRDSPAFVPELDFVATIHERIVGNIMYTKSKIVTAEGKTINTATFGPLSVLPEYHRSGVGTALVNHTVKRAKKMGFAAILIFGHPRYYTRFGFKNAKAYQITTENGKNFDAFMALPLQDGALDSISGTFYTDPVYKIDTQAAKDFDRDFAE